MPTIQDVADYAQVSITTVSHVINGTRYVSDELKERVEKAMDALGYHPNYLARSLRIGQTKTIGLIIPDNSNMYFAEVARTIEDLGYRHGYSVILCNSDDDLEKEKTYINVLVNKQVDGVIFISAGESSENLQQLRDHGTPVVVADRDFQSLTTDTVLLDNSLGGYLATRYLIELGHRKIACISGPSLLTPSAQRVNGYLEALKEANISADERYILHGDFRFESGETRMNQLVQMGQDRPTAVFVCNDMMALGAVRSARIHHLCIPENMSIIGFDNTVLSQASYPALTTIAQPVPLMAETVIQLLLDRIGGKSAKPAQPEFSRIVLKPSLVIRDSCRAIQDG